MFRTLKVVFVFWIVWTAGLAQVAAMDQALWESYRERFISSDGRIIDKANRQISHSEGQGYGMILAVSADDRATFEKIWQWTRNNLQVRGKDRLLAWSWGQRLNGEWNVLDLNNATDGDLLVAYALLKAGERWNDPALRSEAVNLVQDIKKHVTVNAGEIPVLMPGYYGFDKEQGLVLNLSYYVYPALEAFARFDDQNLWSRIIRGGLNLLDRACRPPWNTPPDWIFVRGDSVDVYKERSPRFGYEAIRVPLYLAWAGHHDALRRWAPILDWFERTGTLPLWIDVVDSAISLTDAPGGFYAVWAVVARSIGRPKTAEDLWVRAREKVPQEKDDYYSTSLFLLSLVGLEKP